MPLVWGRGIARRRRVTEINPVVSCGEMGTPDEASTFLRCEGEGSVHSEELESLHQKEILLAGKTL